MTCHTNIKDASEQGCILAGTDDSWTVGEDNLGGSGA